MILFYEKDSGRIIGTIDGRIHGDDHLNMWIGDKDKIDRLVNQWVPTQYYDQAGNKVEKDAKDEKGNPLAFTADFEPDVEDKEQKQIFADIDARKYSAMDFKVDLKSKKLVKLDTDGKNK